jgi:DNA-binding HxlR family transcriptional regulator
VTTATAAQRRDEARAAYDEFLAQCPARQLFARLGDKWVGLVLAALVEGPRRHSSLARELASASQKMLTQTLRGLERDGLVERQVTLAVPVRVEYQLSPLGRSLTPVLSALKQWAFQHMDEVHAARADYDATT